eukprot:jgi/Mesen1/9016/ME000565S08349
MAAVLSMQPLEQSISKRVDMPSESYSGRVDAPWQATYEGEDGSSSFRVVLADREGRSLSLWHSVPFWGPRGYMNCICKSPNSSMVSYEVASGEHGTPLRLSRRANVIVQYASPPAWNVGLLPQTWGNPEILNEDYGGLPYDGKPLEVIDVGARIAETAEVYEVKALAAFAVISCSHLLSWKLVVIRADDANAKHIHDPASLEQYLPGTIAAIREWLRSRGASETSEKDSVFGLNEKVAGLDVVRPVLDEAHSSWQSVYGHLAADARRGFIERHVSLDTGLSKPLARSTLLQPVRGKGEQQTASPKGGGSSASQTMSTKLLKFLHTKLLSPHSGGAGRGFKHSEQAVRHVPSAGSMFYEASASHDYAVLRRTKSHEDHPSLLSPGDEVPPLVDPEAKVRHEDAAFLRGAAMGGRGGGGLQQHRQVLQRSGTGITVGSESWLRGETEGPQGGPSRGALRGEADLARSHTWQPGGARAGLPLSSASREGFAESAEAAGRGGGDFTQLEMLAQLHGALDGTSAGVAQQQLREAAAAARSSGEIPEQPAYSEEDGAGAAAALHEPDVGALAHSPRGTHAGEGRAGTAAELSQGWGDMERLSQKTKRAALKPPRLQIPPSELEIAEEAFIELHSPEAMAVSYVAEVVLHPSERQARKDRAAQRAAAGEDAQASPSLGLSPRSGPSPHEAPAGNAVMPAGNAASPDSKLSPFRGQNGEAGGGRQRGLQPPLPPMPLVSIMRSSRTSTPGRRKAGERRVHFKDTVQVISFVGSEQSRELRDDTSPGGSRRLVPMRPRSPMRERPLEELGQSRLAPRLKSPKVLPPKQDFAFKFKPSLAQAAEQGQEVARERLQQQQQQEEEEGARLSSPRGQEQAQQQPQQQQQQQEKLKAVKAASRNGAVLPPADRYGADMTNELAQAQQAVERRRARVPDRLAHALAAKPVMDWPPAGRGALNNSWRSGAADADARAREFAGVRSASADYLYYHKKVPGFQAHVGSHKPLQAALLRAAAADGAGVRPMAAMTASRSRSYPMDMERSATEAIEHLKGMATSTTATGPSLLSGGRAASEYARDQAQAQLQSRPQGASSSATSPLHHGQAARFLTSTTWEGVFPKSASDQGRGQFAHEGSPQRRSLQPSPQYAISNVTPA